LKLALITSVGFLALALTTGCATAVGTEGGDAATSPASKDGGTTSDSGPTKKDAGSSSTQDDSGTITPTDDGGQPLDDTTCSNLSTKGQCEQCCLKVHPSGYGVYHQALVDCTCTAPGACATECATESCANKPTTPGDACEQCITSSLGQSGACYNPVASACQGDTDCTALFGTCIPPCESK
jgi:hypothetical protein